SPRIRHPTGIYAFTGGTAIAAKFAGKLEAIPDSVAVLRNLKQQFKLGILSNIDDDLFSATAPELEIEFDHVITASQARAYKPSPDIFRLAQNKIGLPPQQWVHAGQSIYHDVIPAQSMGIATVW